MMKKLSYVIYKKYFAPEEEKHELIKQEIEAIKILEKNKRKSYNSEDLFKNRKK